MDGLMDDMMDGVIIGLERVVEGWMNGFDDKGMTR